MENQNISFCIEVLSLVKVTSSSDEAYAGAYILYSNSNDTVEYTIKIPTSDSDYAYNYLAMAPLIADGAGHFYYYIAMQRENLNDGHNDLVISRAQANSNSLTFTTHLNFNKSPNNFFTFNDANNYAYFFFKNSDGNMEFSRFNKDTVANQRYI